MSKNTKVWNVPEGYELDKEQSTETKVVLKKIEDKRVDSWQEYCELMKDKDSCFVDMNDNIRSSRFSSGLCVGEFEDKEDAVAFAALHKLISLRKNWISDWKPDWTNKDQMKFSIARVNKGIGVGENQTVSRSMSFPTREMRDEFFDTFRDLLDEAESLL